MSLYVWGAFGEQISTAFLPDSDLTRQASPEIYLSFWQTRAYSKHLLVCTEAEPLAMASAVNAALREVNPYAAVEHINTFDEIRDDALAGRSFAMQLLVGFAAVGDC